MRAAADRSQFYASERGRKVAGDALLHAHGIARGLHAAARTQHWQRVAERRNTQAEGGGDEEDESSSDEESDIPTAADDLAAMLASDEQRAIRAAGSAHRDVDYWDRVVFTPERLAEYGPAASLHAHRGL